MNNKVFSTQELQDLYANRGNLTSTERAILDAAMWVRARMANFNGYSKQWHNIKVKDGKIYYWDLDDKEQMIPSYAKGKVLPIEEDNIISKTSPDGETSFEAVPEDVARQLNGTTTTDIKGNKTTVKDTGRKTLGEIEGPGKPALNQQDILNLAKDLDVCTKEALRATGNEVAYTQMFFNKAKATITIKAYFQQNADNPGKPEGQEFSYKLAEGKVVLEHGDTVTNISAIQTQSGTANINRDLAIDSIKKVLNRRETVATGEAGTTELGRDVEDKPMMEEFGKAVDAYRKNKTKDTIKELLRTARAFPGDDIQHKFQNAVQMYKGQGTTDGCPECQSSDCDLKLSESLFIRLLEFAKEDAKDDVDLHEIAENLARICAEGRCASIEDYDTILGDFKQNHPDAETGEQPEPEPEQLQEEVNNPVAKLAAKISPEATYMVYTETKEDRGGYVEGEPGEDQTMRGSDIIDYLQSNADKIESCYMPARGTVQIIFKTIKAPLHESEPDERERWDDDDDYKAPEEETFHYDPETKRTYEDETFTAEPGKRYVTGRITCIDTDIADESFDHEFGTEHIYVPICTEVGIEIEGLSDEYDFYDTEEDKATAEGMLTKEDYDIIQDWGKSWMTDHIEQY